MKHFHLFLLAGLLLFSLGCGEEKSDGGNGEDPTAEQQAGEPTYTLRYTLENDESWATKDQRIETTTLNPGSPEESITRLKTVIIRKYNSTGLDKENAQNITMTYTRVYAEYQGPDGEWIYDSEVPIKGRQPTGGFEHMVGASMDLRLDRNSGKVFDLRGGNAIVERMTGDTNAAKLGDRIMTEQAMPEFQIFPDGPVPIGGTWEREGAFSSRYHVKYLNTYTLESRDGQTAVVKVSTEVSPLEAEKAILGQGPNGSAIRHELSGSSTETITVEEISGRVTIRTANTSLEGDRLQLNAAGEEVSRTPIKIDIERNTEISIK